MSPNLTIDQFRLDGQRCVVTGAAGLLGRVFADALADAGATVLMVDANEERLAEVTKPMVTCHGQRIEPVVLDITNEEEVTRWADGEREKGLYALINSAAVDPKFEPDESGSYADNGAFPTYSLENWKRSLDVNLTGTFLMTRAVCQIMEIQGEGAVVNISSTYGLSGPDQRIYEGMGRESFFKPVDYSTTKAGLIGFTRAVAAYYRDTAIRVNALAPGGADNNHADAFVQNYAYRTIMGRMADPNEYRGAIVFLCSRASSYMTGATLVVDGGWTAL